MTMPLAAGYLKAVVDQHPDLSREFEVRIFNFAGDMANIEMLQRLFFDEVPDIAAFVVYGWNSSAFQALSETYKQLNRSGWVIWGGPHVTYQEQTFFGRSSSIDVLVNGEGERTWIELLAAYLNGRSFYALDDIKGISFRKNGEKPLRTPDRERIIDLDEIPSPLLTGAVDILDRDKRPLYPYVLMETNRGCPYACAFCYWGGAIGQKLRSFSLDRLREEVEFVAHSGYDNIMLCDANFAMVPRDEEFLEACIEIRNRLHRPRQITTSWAKNKGQVFHRIVKRMQQTGMEGTFNLALQSLSEPTIAAMGRKNMKINDWETLAIWLKQNGLNVYGELIWGCPGETVESFLDGYDRLARHVSYIAVYPLYIMPNTDYSVRRDTHGLITWRPGEQDFEQVLAHKTMTIQDNRRMHGFLYLARVIAEHLVFRWIWTPLYRLTELSQSAILLNFGRWIEQSDNKVARQLKVERDNAVARLEIGSPTIDRGLRIIYSAEDPAEVFLQWWGDAVRPLLPERHAEFLTEVFRYDALTMPIYIEGPEQDDVHSVFAPITIGARAFFVRRDVRFAFDINSAWRHFVDDDNVDPGALERRPARYDIYYRRGFCSDMQLYHNAQNLRFFGRPVPQSTSANRDAYLDRFTPTERDWIVHKSHETLNLDQAMPGES